MLIILTSFLFCVISAIIYGGLILRETTPPMHFPELNMPSERVISLAKLAFA